MAKSRNVLKRKGGSHKKKHVRFNLSQSRKRSRRTLKRSSTLGVALKKRTKRRRHVISSRTRTKTVARGKTRSRGRSRSRLGGFRGGYGPGGGPLGAPWDGAEHVPGDSVQGMPSANHYAYSKGGIGVGGVDPALSTRTIGGNQRGGGLMDFMPQTIHTAIDVGRDVITGSYNDMTMNSATNSISSLPTKHYIDNESKIVYPENPLDLDQINVEAAIEAAAT